MPSGKKKVATQSCIVKDEKGEKTVNAHQRGKRTGPCKGEVEKRLESGDIEPPRGLG